MAIWRISENGVENVAVTGLEESITAVQFAPGLSPEGKYIITAGLENGLVEIFSFDAATNVFESLQKLDRSTAHSRTIRRLRFRPVEGAWQSGAELKENKMCWELASCSDDRCVKVHRIEWEASSC
uniref:WD_REPEATS_REGION domain-containing protein n=1 Tax=Steinernema glaseri TaxID=37863 RepID=A0A1I8A3X6_9BILA